MSSAETTAVFTYKPADELAALTVGDTVEVVSWPFPSIRKVAPAARSFVEKSVKEAGHGE